MVVQYIMAREREREGRGEREVVSTTITAVISLQCIGLQYSSIHQKLSQ